MNLEIYKNKGSKVDTIKQEAVTAYKVEKIDGTLRYIKGVPYPQKGYPTPETVWAGNQAKILFREGLYFLKTPRILSIKYLEKMLVKYNTIASKATDPYILQRKYQQPIAKEIGDMCYDFLTRIGISDETANKFAEIFSSIPESDNAYAIRIMDIMSETTKEKLLENPQKEMKRLLELFAQREVHSTVIEKFRNLQKLVSMMLYVPKYRKAFLETINGCIFENLQYDEADRYWAHFREDYKCFGKSFEERQKIVEEEGMPVAQKYAVQNYSKEDMDKMIADGIIKLIDGMWTKVK
jgi:hypothetical protein